jgi:hypothetical protein
VDTNSPIEATVVGWRVRRQVSARATRRATALRAKVKIDDGV